MSTRPGVTWRRCLPAVLPVDGPVRRHTFTAVLLALLKELVWAIAGSALLGTIGNGLVTALNHERHRRRRW